MSKVVGIGNLADAVSQILDDYGDEALDVIREVAPEVGKQAKKNLKSSSPKDKGKYAAGWAVQTQTTRNGVSVVVYNKNKPGLTHLLEHGHALRGGGRAPAQPHIEAVNAQAQEEFLEQVEGRLSK